MSECKKKKIFRGEYILRIAIKLTILTVLLANSASALSNSGGGNWQNYTNITLTNTGSVLIDFQVMINLTGSNFPVNAQSGGADIRFTDSSGNELNYWFNDWNYPVNAHIWVKVPDVPNGTSNIKMFYGNPLASSSINGNATFEFFDDFSGSLDTTNKWTLGYASANSPTTSITGGVLKVTSNGVSWAALHTQYSVGASDQIIFYSRERVISLDKDPFTSGYVDAANNNLNRFGIRENALSDGNKYVVQTRVDGGAFADSAIIATIPQNDWFMTEIIRESPTQFTAKIYDDSGNMYGNNTSTEANWSDNSFWRNVYVVDTSGLELDIVYARKYNSSEPDTTLGAEESAPLNTYVDATYSDGSAGGHVFGYDAFNTLEDGINAVAPGGIVNVAAGTYTEPSTVGPQIVINKDVSIVGADKNTTIIKPSADTGWGGTTSDLSGWFLINPGYEFNLRDVTLDGDGKKIAQAIRSHGAGTIQNNIVKNINYSAYIGFGIVTFDDNMIISDNNLINITRIGIYVGSGVTNAVISGNTYTGKGDGDWLDYGIEVERGGTATITGNIVSNCTGVAASDGSTSAGILATTYFNPGTTATITGNDLINNFVGIAVGYNSADTTTVVAHYNNFTGNGEGVNSTNATVDATLNWWGSSTGPGPVGPGTGDNVSTNVIYTPWIGMGGVAGETRHYSTVDNELTSSKVSTLSDVGTNFVIPQYGNGVSWHTKVYMTDYSGLGSTLTVQYYDESGNPGVIETPSIPANGTISWTPTDGTNSRPLIGKMVITSDHDVLGEFILNSTSNTDLISSRLYTSADMGTSFIIPQYGNGVSWHTFVAISDVSGLGANLTLKYYDINGVLAQTEYPNITANGMYRFTPSDGTNSRPLIGKLEITSDNTITGEFRVYSLVNAGILSNKLYTSADMKKTFVIPSYGNGVSWHSWIAISDVSGLGANLTIKYYDAAGNLVVIETPPPIVPNGMYRTIITDGTNSRPLIGKLEITSDNDVAGEMRIYPTTGRGITATSLYTQLDISNTLIVPYYGNNNNFHTYLALSDFSGSSGDIRLEYHSLSGGAPVKIETQTIPANGMYKWGQLEGTGGAPIEGNIFIYR